MANTYHNILRYGLQASYDALTEKDSSVLYFATDSKKIYKGDIDFTDSVVIAATKPSTPVAGKVYILGDTSTVEAYVNGAWNVISYAKTSAIDADSTDVQIASAKAIYDYVQSVASTITSSDKVIDTIASKDGSNGTVTYTTADGTSHDVALTGVVTDPAYDATTRTITLPVVGSDDLVIALGKDIYIDPNGDNSYHSDTQEIWLTLNDGDNTTDATVIKIPATSLVDVYTGGSTTSVAVTVSDTNEITAAAVIRPNSTEEGSEFTNGLKVGETGLYVDLSAYALAADVKATTDALDTAVKAAQADVDAAQTQLDIVDGSADTEGSFRNLIASTKATIDATTDALATRVSANESAIETLNGDADTEGSVANAVAAESTVLKNGVIKTAQDTADQAVLDAATAQAAAEAAQSTADDNAANIAALANATTVWGTF